MNYESRINNQRASLLKNNSYKKSYHDSRLPMKTLGSKLKNFVDKLTSSSPCWNIKA